MNGSELWGTFSVLDHKRPRAFVAEVLIYDRLVIPFPPPGDGAEYGRWRRNKWKPDRLSDFLDILREEDLVLEVPWDEQMRSQWEALYESRNDTNFGNNRGWDLSDFQQEVEQIRQSAPGDAPFLATAGLMARCVHGNPENPAFKKLVALTRTSNRPIEPVIAYRSFHNAKNEQQVGTRDVSTAEPRDERYHLFGWDIFVPEDSGKSDIELLRIAARFASRSDLREVRQSFNAWVKRLSEGGVEPDEAVTKLNSLFKEYRDMTRGAWRTHTLRWVARLAPVATPWAGLINPLIGAGATSAAAVLALTIERFVPKPEVPAGIKPVVYVNQARKFFRKR